jgi:hypothetical protein
LNSSVYRARVTFVICIPFADCQLRDTFRGGKIMVRSIGSRSFQKIPIDYTHYRYGLFGLIRRAYEGGVLLKRGVTSNNGEIKSCLCHIGCISLHPAIYYFSTCTSLRKTYVADDVETGGDIFQHLRDIFAQLRQLTTARCAGFFSRHMRVGFAW